MSNPVQERIAREISEHDVVLFMKGTPVFPQCGFSSLVVRVLSHLGVKFKGVDVLLALVERAGQLVSKNELLDLVWPGLVVEENNLQVQISTLRKLLGPQAIATIPGRGYRWTLAPDNASAQAAKSQSAPSASSAGSAARSSAHAL